MQAFTVVIAIQVEAYQVASACHLADTVHVLHTINALSFDLVFTVPRPNVPPPLALLHPLFSTGSLSRPAPSQQSQK